MKKILKRAYGQYYKAINFYYCIVSGLKYNPTFKIRGKLILKKASYYQKSGTLIIGDHFKANSKTGSNSLGVIQPVIINISSPDSKIIIGNNVGISGSTLNARISITIGNNVMIGSGCIITDTDSHSLDYRFRDDPDKVKSKPITISDNVFIGARTLIMKGVNIGEGAVIGAGSVIIKDIPPFTVFAGNPAVYIKNINLD